MKLQSLLLRCLLLEICTRKTRTAVVRSTHKAPGVNKNTVSAWRIYIVSYLFEGYMRLPTTKRRKKINKASEMYDITFAACSRYVMYKFPCKPEKTTCISINICLLITRRRKKIPFALFYGPHKVLMIDLWRGMSHVVPTSSTIFTINFILKLLSIFFPKQVPLKPKFEVGHLAMKVISV